MISVVLNDIEEPIKGVIKDSFTITEAFDGHSMTMQAIKLDDDPSFDMLVEDAQIIVDQEHYTIVSVDDVPPIKTIIGIHEFYDIYDDHVEGKLIDGIYSIENALSKAFSSSPDWTWSVTGTFESAFLSDFGEDNPIALTQTIKSVYGAEVKPTSVNKHVTFAPRIGVDLDEQVRYKHNLVSISRKIDANNVKTAVKVYYNVQPNGEYLYNLTFESPNKNAFRRLKWAKPLYLDHITNEADAIKAAQNYLQDKAIISITAELAAIKDAGFELNDISLGDSFWLIDERLNEQDRARVVEIRKYPLSSKSPVVSFANRVKNMSDSAIKQQQQHNALNNVAVKQGRYYNGVNITPENGIKVESENGVVLMLNATEGILLTRNGTRKFYVDTNGSVTFDGRLHITNGPYTLLEAFLDTHGGRLIINNIDGLLNVKLGSEEDGYRQGGILKLYNDGEQNQMVELSAAGQTGLLNLKYANGANSAALWGGALQLFSGNNPYAETMLAPTFGIINNESIATQPWVTSRGYATQSYVNSQGYVTASTVQWMINSALASYTPPSNG